METFGQLIRRLRTERGETLAHVADSISSQSADEAVKISVPMLSRIETDDRYPSARIGLVIARYFGVNPDRAMSLLAMSQVQKKLSSVPEAEYPGEPHRDYPAGSVDADESDLDEFSADYGFDGPGHPSRRPNLLLERSSPSRRSKPGESSPNLRAALRSEVQRPNPVTNDRDKQLAEDALAAMERMGNQLESLLDSGNLDARTRRSIANRVLKLSRDIKDSAGR